jgi:hypothetical protein
MAESLKKLTVSYGAFACTLEGFDDPFPVMKMVVDYFQSLAERDPSFGAHPERPDADYLRRLAQRGSNHAVEVETHDNGVVLRQSFDHVPESAEEFGAEAVVALAAGRGAGLTLVPKDETEPSHAILAAADFADEVAGSLSPEAGEPARDQSDPMPALEREERALDRLLAVARERSGAAETLSAANPLTRLRDVMDDIGQMPDFADALPAEALPDAAFTAAFEKPANDEFAPQPTGDMAGTGGSDVEMIGLGTLPVEAPGEAAPDLSRPPAGDDTPAREALPENPAPPREFGAEPEEQARLGETFSDDADRMSSIAPVQDDAPAPENMAKSGISTPAETAAPARSGAVADFAAGDLTDEPVLSGPEAGADPEMALAPMSAEDRADRPADPETVMAAPVERNDMPPALPGEAPVVMATSLTWKHPDADEPPAAPPVHGAMEGPDAATPDLPASELLTDGAAPLTAPPAEEVRDLRAFMEAAEDIPEDARLTEEDSPAEFAWNGQEAEMVPPADAAPQPEVAAEPVPEPPPAPSQPSLPPLILGPALRVVETEPGPEIADGTAAARGEEDAESPPPAATTEIRRQIVRPRVVAEDFAYDPSERQSANMPVEPLPATAGSEDSEPADQGDLSITLDNFARKVGAASLPELLEASAAYVTIVSGQPRFSRASILNMVDELSDERTYTQEARIKSFGKLLRNGSILRVEDGKFAISHSAKFNYEVKISA